METAHDKFYQPPTWEVRVNLGPAAVIRNAKIYHQGRGVHERHFANDITTLAQVLAWANEHLGDVAGLGPEHLLLVS